MRIRAVAATAALAAIVASAACSGSGVFRQYEYEEEVYLSLDGRATMYVNASIPALNALRGTSFDTAPNVPVDRTAVRRFFEVPGTHDLRLNVSLRSNRRFVHVRMDVDNIHRLAETTPFSWSHYALAREGDVYVYRQSVGASVAKDVGSVGWNGRELVAFRLHLPSRIVFQNTEGPPQRGNILVWEQPLADRLQGRPVPTLHGAVQPMEARMETQSILYRTLYLFGITFVAVAVTFVVVIWWVLRRRPATGDARSEGLL
jgi:hypothetical protein